MDIFDNDNKQNISGQPLDTAEAPATPAKPASAQDILQQAESLADVGKTNIFSTQQEATKVAPAVNKTAQGNIFSSEDILPVYNTPKQNTGSIPEMPVPVQQNIQTMPGAVYAHEEKHEEKLDEKHEETQVVFKAAPEEIVEPAPAKTAEKPFVNPLAEPVAKAHFDETPEKEVGKEQGTVAMPAVFQDENNKNKLEDKTLVANKVPALFQEENQDETKIQKAVAKTKDSKDGKMAKKKKTVGKTAVKNVFKALFITACVGVVFMCIMAVQLSLYLVDVTKDDDTLLNLENVRGSQGQNSLILGVDPLLKSLPIDRAHVSIAVESNWVVTQELSGNERRVWVDLAEVPDDLVNGFLAIEDRVFFEHDGINVGRTIYAAINNVFKIESYEFGASTLNQQLIKNLTGDDEFDEMRKIREIYRAIVMDKNYSKEMILEAYLNTVSLSENIRGVQAGALDYFGKEVKDLTLSECATIAGITRSPTEYSPRQSPEGSLARRNRVLEQMHGEGFITKEQYEAAIATPLGVVAKVAEEDEEVARDSSIYSYYTDMVIEDVIKDLQSQRGWTLSEATNAVYSGGLKIYTPVDVEMQNLLDDIFLNGEKEDGWFATRVNNTGRTYMQTMGYTQDEPLLDEDGNPVLDEDGEPVMKVVYPEAAMVIMGYDGTIQAVAGGVGQKEANRDLNRATQSYRQTGSTMKPIAAYSLAIDYGIVTYSTAIPDRGISMQETPVIVDPETNERVNNWPQNINNPPYRTAPVPIVSAISQSFNTVAAQVGQMVGPEVMFEFMRNTLQVDSIIGPDEAPDWNGKTDIGVGPLALGMLTKGMTVVEVASSYQMFGNGGEYFPPRSYYKVVDYKGDILLESDDTGTQAISADSAYIMNRMLYTVLRSGAAPGVYATAGGKALPYLDSVAKTGSSDDWRDRWFVGLTPYYVSAVWWGYDNDQPSAANKINLKPWRSDGGNIPVNLWYDVMVKMQEEMPEAHFPSASDTIVEKAFCVGSGMLAGPGCPDTRTGYYSEEHDLPNTCYEHNGAPEE